MNEWLQEQMQGMDPEMAQEMLRNLDEDQVQQAIDWMIQEMVVPHLEEVRQRSKEDPPTAEVRAYFEEMGPEEREDEFYETLDEFVATLVECRERPNDGFPKLKTMLRDPFTVEALLLIFENENHIDAEYTAQLKEFGVTHLRWIGAMVLPEMYDDAEVRRVLDQFDLDAEGYRQ